MTRTTESHDRSTRREASKLATLDTVPLVGLASLDIDMTAPAGATNAGPSDEA